MHTANGNAVLQLLPRVDITIEGIAVTVPALIDRFGTAGIILGRSALLEAVDAGFCPDRWLWKQP